MRNTGRILDIMERALTGPMMEEATFDKVHVTEGIKRVVADYDIKVDTGKLINQDDDMADRV
ncbi:MAG: hypothetical protein HOD92_09575, partial [Deltaproteobacteria bacterium]|nr:hypothetical protein [Deltaproteobacteria bacterium]